MGVDYSVSVGYGFVMDDQKMPEQFEDDPVSEMLSWLRENNYDKLGTDWAGNAMSGPTFVFVYIKDTYFSKDIYELDGTYDIDYNVDYESQRQLLEVASHFGVDPWSIGSKVIGNVS